MPTTIQESVICHDCRAECVPSGHTTGYGEYADGRKVCFACCGKLDRAEMIETGRAVLYLSHVNGSTEGKVTNWPGTLSFPVYVRKGRHNIARNRYDVQFTGPDGRNWYGTQYGDNTQICRCKRAK